MPGHCPSNCLYGSCLEPLDTFVVSFDTPGCSIEVPDPNDGSDISLDVVFYKLFQGLSGIERSSYDLPKPILRFLWCIGLLRWLNKRLLPLLKLGDIGSQPRFFAAASNFCVAGFQQPEGHSLNPWSKSYVFSFCGHKDGVFFVSGRHDCDGSQGRFPGHLQAFYPGR